MDSSCEGDSLELVEEQTVRTERNEDQEIRRYISYASIDSSDTSKIGSTPTPTTEHDANVLIFFETFIKHLASETEKNKEKLKWTGSLTDFRDL